MGWMISQTQLDPEQRDFINISSRQKNNIWIKGHAGSGKTVLMVHSIREKLERDPSLRIGVVLFTHALIDLVKTGMREVGLPLDDNGIPVMTWHYFMNRDHSRYDVLFVDEIQDLNGTILQEIRLRADQVIVAGDSTQSIYDKVPGYWDESTLTPSQIRSILSAEEHDLTIIHRLTRSIKEMVSKVFKEVLNSKIDATKIDVKPRIFNFQSKDEEIRFVWEEAQKGPAVNESSAVFLYRQEDVFTFVNDILCLNEKPLWEAVKNTYGKIHFGAMNDHLNKVGVKLAYIGNAYGSLEDAVRYHKVVVMTYHSAKGLDFHNVFLPGLESDKGNDTLFMVGLTRSRKNLYLTYRGARSTQLQRFATDIPDSKGRLGGDASAPEPTHTVFDF